MSELILQQKGYFTCIRYCIDFQTNRLITVVSAISLETKQNKKCSIKKITSKSTYCGKQEILFFVFSQKNDHPKGYNIIFERRIKF